MDTFEAKKKRLTPRQSIREVLLKMEVGDERDWFITQMASVRTMASMVGLELERVYKTSTDRNTRKITVCRVS